MRKTVTRYCMFEKATVRVVIEEVRQISSENMVQEILHCAEERKHCGSHHHCIYVKPMGFGESGQGDPFTPKGQ